MDAEIFSLADRIIETLKMRKIVDLKMLIQETGGDEKDIRRIINLLEQQGMADVEYKLTKVVISWNDEADRIGRAKTLPSGYHRISFDSSGKVRGQPKQPTVPLSSGRYNVRLQSEPDPVDRVVERLGSAHLNVERETPKQAEPEVRTSLLDLGLGRDSEQRKETDYIAQKAPVAQKVHEEKPETKKERQNDSISDRLMPKLDRIDAPGKGRQERLSRKEERLRKEVDEEVKEIERSLRSKLKGRAPEADLAGTDIVASVRREHSSRKAKQRGAVLRRYLSTPATASKASRITPAAARAENAQTFAFDVTDSTIDASADERIDRQESLSSDLGAKMDLIRGRKSELAALSRQKAGLLEESYAPLESKIEAELTVISDIVSEREKKLKSLKERLKSLPENLGSLEVESIELRNAEAEAKARFDGVLTDLQTLASEIKSIKSAVNGELVDVKKSLRQQDSDLRDLRELHEKHKAKESDVQNSIEIVRSRIEREQMQLGDLEQKLLEIQASSSDIRQRLDDVETHLDESSVFGKSATDLVGRLRDLEGGVSTVHTAYSDAKSRLLDDIDRYERELLSLRESVEAGFARKYLAEIEKLTDKHDQELVAVAERERSLDDVIAQKREEMRALIEDARDMQARLGSALPRRQTRSIEEIRKDLGIERESSDNVGEDSASAERKGMIESLGDIFSRLKKD